MSAKNFLVEIGTEELPPKILRILAETFAANFTVELDKANLTHGNIRWFATSRRLAVKVKDLATQQPDCELKKRGPAINKAFDINGKPNEIAKSWAYSCGISIDQTEYLIDDKGKWLLYHTYIKGKNVELLLPNIVDISLIKLPIKKLMRWGTSNVYFIRPIRTVTMLLGDRLIPEKILGIKSDRIIRGHRFMGEPEFIIDNADQYPQLLLERGKVIADYEQRKNKIKVAAEKAAQEIGGKLDLNDELLEEVTSLVEWPVVLIAKFEEKFLTIPADVLIYTIKNKQKCFPIYSINGNLLSSFIFIANIESKNFKQIISGNEKVMHARLSDVEFFFNTDRKKRLEEHLPSLETVLFQKQLGSLREKTDRIQVLSGWIAVQIGANANHAIRAGLLSKCDLMTNMVLEFDDIKGVIGMHYARFDGEEEDVAISLKEQYLPRFAGDKIPSSLVGCAVAIADKIDTIVGILGIGKYPISSKDPFALRRAALGILRIILEKNLIIDLQDLTNKTVNLYGNKLINTNIVDNVIYFIMNRFRTWYQNKGYSIDVIQAVLACRPTCPVDCDARIRAVSYFRTLKISADLSTINKRISNILAKSNEKPNNIIYPSILKEESEIKLFLNLEVLHDKLRTYFIEGSYQNALIELANLKEPIDEFLRNVMVNTDNKNLRINRITLLTKLRELFLQIADISLLQ